MIKPGFDPVYGLNQDQERDYGDETRMAVNVLLTHSLIPFVGEPKHRCCNVRKRHCHDIVFLPSDWIFFFILDFLMLALACSFQRA